VFAGKRHLDDNALIRRYLADRGLAALEAQDETLLRHLAHCPACEARYESVRASLDDVRQAATEDAEAACSPERMERQRERILRRVEALHDGPRVLPFPAAGQSAHAAAQPRVLRRWVAAAAAAGLLVGLSAGRLLFVGEDQAPMQASRQQAPVAAPAAARPSPTMRALHPEPAFNDDEFLSAVDQATSAPRTQELRAIYAFTLGEPRDPLRAVKKN
jgi:hypothetical protein